MLLGVKSYLGRESGPGVQRNDIFDSRARPDMQPDSFNGADDT